MYTAGHIHELFSKYAQPLTSVSSLVLTALLQQVFAHASFGPLAAFSMQRTVYDHKNRLLRVSSWKESVQWRKFDVCGLSHCLTRSGFETALRQNTHFGVYERSFYSQLNKY